MHVQTTFTPEQEVQPERPSISPELFQGLGVSLFDSIETALGQRTATLDPTLDYWNDMYEMNVAPRNTPWPNAVSICVPIVALNLEVVQSRLVTAVFVPRFYIAVGNTQQASDNQHQVERFYNAEFYKNGWLFPHLDCTHLALRDGASVMEVLWKYKEVIRPVVVFSKELDPQGQEILGPDGQAIYKKSFEKIKVIEHNGVSLEAVELRDFLLIPSASVSIDAAPAVARKIYMTEPEIRELVASGTFDKDAAEKVINYLTYGQTELPMDEQGTATYQQGGTLEVGDEGNMDPGDGTTRARGAFEIWRVHSRQYDLDGDGVFEENVFWVHHTSQTLLGWGPYEYWHGKRPFVKFAPMPRPRRFQGFSVAERLRSFQEEANARHNQRGDIMDLIIAPPIWYTQGVKQDVEKWVWSPGTKIPVTSKDDIGLLQLGQIDPASVEEEMLLYRFAQQMVGIESPQLPVSGNQKTNQKQLMMQQTASNVRLDLMALYLRQSCKQVIHQVHQLNLQYGDDQMANPDGSQGFSSYTKSPDGTVEKFKIPAPVLAQDFTLDIAGNQGPLDKDNRRMDVMTFYALLMQNPLVAGHLDRVWYATSLVAEQFNVPAVERFIGTVEDALQQQQQQAQAAKEKEDRDFQLQLASHSKNPSPTGGASGKNGKSPAEPPSAPQPPPAPAAPAGV